MSMAPHRAPGDVPAVECAAVGEGALRRVAQLVAERVDPALRGADIGDAVEHVLAGTHRASAPPGNGRQGHRWQDSYIEDHVPVGASVLDLGCGEGRLLATLRDRKCVRCQGVELDPEAVAQCVERDVPVIQADLDAGLEAFLDSSFDYVILEETLQTLHHPVRVLEGMLRVARRSIVSFPNFAHWQVRLDLALRGRMPVTRALPRRWFDTLNIHLLTIQDFLDWATSRGVTVYEAVAFAGDVVRPLEEADNLHAEEAAFVVGREGEGR
jgi:methionine biosynthesis protein MetW